MATLTLNLNINSRGDFVFNGGIPIEEDNAQLIEDLRKADGAQAKRVAGIVADALRNLRHDYTRTAAPFEDTLISLLIACVQHPNTTFEALAFPESEV
jgi:uncharacterized protein YbjT (DUF2867 family)